jgi:ArsR family transcriptional regulator
MEMHMLEILPVDQSNQEWSDDCECLHPRAVMAARRAIGDAPAMEKLAGIFAILADPTRMRVLVALGNAELCVTDLAVATGVNRTTVSHQLRVLRQHRLVRRRREGKVVYYALDDDHVQAMVGMAAAHVAEADAAPLEQTA